MGHYGQGAEKVEAWLYSGNRGELFADIRTIDKEKE